MTGTLTGTDWTTKSKTELVKQARAVIEHPEQYGQADMVSLIEGFVSRFDDDGEPPGA
jgi:hypothetical protein